MISGRPTPVRMIVASPKDAIVVSRPTPRAKPVGSPKKVVNKSPVVASSSIADRVIARQVQFKDKEPEMSIAEHVVAHRQQKEQANPVLNFNTGEMLEYRQLLRHPKYREIWNRAAVNEFGQLAQGMGGRVKGTDTI